MANIRIQADVSKLKALATRGPQALEDALAMVAEELVNDIKLSMVNSPPTGRHYNRSGRTHVASSAPNPPRPDMGTLLGSLRASRRGRLSHRIEDGVEYGVWLELGGENLEARPFMRPAFEDYKASKFAEIIRQALGA